MTSHLSNRSQIWSIHDLERHYKTKTGGFWFDKDSMRFFKSRVSETLLYSTNTIYFFSSEQGPDTTRRYSIRSYTPDTGEIDTCGLGFMGYKTLAAAKLAARELVQS